MMYSNKSAASSTTGEGSKRPGSTGTDNPRDQTYYVEYLNSSNSNNDEYFQMPECVMDAYLKAKDGGDDSDANFRQMSEVYGSSRDLNYNFNSNVWDSARNLNPEPLPNEGCGCTGSYNGGAGAGTAVCDDECGGDPYEAGFNDKKRDPNCCVEVQDGLNASSYVPVYSLPISQPPSGATAGGFVGQTPSSADRCLVVRQEATYQQQLTNKKPDCIQPYIPVLPPPQPYCAATDATCCGPVVNQTAIAATGCCVPVPVAPGCCAPDTYELIRNTDAQRYKGKGPDRSNFYGGEDCQGSNNNFTSVQVIPQPNDWATLRKNAYSPPSPVYAARPNLVLVNPVQEPRTGRSYGVPKDVSNPGSYPGSDLQVQGGKNFAYGTQKSPRNTSNNKDEQDHKGKCEIC